MARTTIARPGFLDRLGDRVVVTDRSGGDLEVLRLRPDLTADAAFETCLEARAEQLMAFQHHGAARVRGISRLPAPDGRLAVVSDAVAGWRLSEVLQAAEHENRLIHTSTALFLLRQVAAVIGALQALDPEISHGALGPERVVVGPGGRVLVVEYVLGTALNHLPPVSADRLWKDFRIAVPSDASADRFGRQTDVLQLGIIALSLIHNRLLRRDEYPGRLTELVQTATESGLMGARQPIGASLRTWLERALGLAPDAGLWTVDEAQHGLDSIVAKEGGYFSTPVGLEPLLQSVDRFFTVPAADLVPAPAAPYVAADPTTSPKAEATPASPRDVAILSEPTPSEPPTDKANAAESRIEAHQVLPTATAGALVQALDEEPAGGGEEPGGHGRVLSWVKPADDGPDEQVAPAIDPLLVTSSPLAEFAAERMSNPFPVPPDVGTPTTPRPALRPVLPIRSETAGEAVSSAPAVAPVADMLSVDSSTPTRRSGWSNEAWMSRSGDRQPSGGRPMLSGSGPVARVAKSGGAATAAALRVQEAPPLPTEPAPVREARPAAAVARSPRPELTPAAAAPPSVPRAEVRAPAKPIVPPAHDVPSKSSISLRDGQAAGGGSRSLFGVPDHSTGREAEDVAGAEPGGKGKWIAIGAVVLACAGGLIGWSFWGPSKTPRPVTGITSPLPKTGEAVQPPAISPAGTTAPAESAKVPATPEAAPLTIAPPVDPQPAMGSVELVSPFPVGVAEKGQPLGTSGTRISLTVGRHVLEVSNEEVGFRGAQAVDVRAGRVSRVVLALPRGAVNINATPWAEVFVDGQRIGETPLGNVQMTVGSHEVRFRHPQLGEQVRSVVVTTGAPGRLSVDMKQ